MARKKQATDNAFVLFDVLYQDGARTSNRKVPSELLGGLDGDAGERGLAIDRPGRGEMILVRRRPRRTHRRDDAPRSRRSTRSTMSRAR